MPRYTRSAEWLPHATANALAPKLAEELQQKRESGQPVIIEQEFGAGTLRVVVVWDEWDRLPLDERTSVILHAYELAGEDKRQIALASGLTVPEAHASGMLPFRIVTALRKGDAVTEEQCRQALIDEGASRLIPNQLQLRFATHQDAVDSIRRLVSRLPESDQVWLIVEDMAAFEE